MVNVPPARDTIGLVEGIVLWLVAVASVALLVFLVLQRGGCAE